MTWEDLLDYINYLKEVEGKSIQEFKMLEKARKVEKLKIEQEKKELREREEKDLRERREIVTRETKRVKRKKANESLLTPLTYMVETESLK